MQIIYISKENEKYKVDKNSIQKDLSDVETYDGSDELAKKVYFNLCSKRRNFLNYIEESVETKINQKSSIKCDTIRNLKDYISKFQSKKDDMKEKIKNFEKQIEGFTEEIKSTKGCNGTSDKENISKAEYEKLLEESKKSIPILKNQIDLIKDINRDIKFEALNSFGVASIKTVDNCIKKFIETFNSQIVAWKEVLRKKG